MEFDKLEKRVVEYYYEHIMYMEDIHKMGLKIRMASDISGVPDGSVEVGHHPCPFNSEGFVCHRYRDCHVAAHVIRSGYAYDHGKVDPSWNPDNHPMSGHSSAGQSSSNPIDKREGEVLIARGVDVAMVKDGDSHMQ